jgi:hypothetical protein
MKKLAIALVIALIATVVTAIPTLAWCPPDESQEANTEVTCSEIGVSDESPVVGTTITFYGTVTITAKAENSKNYYSLSPKGTVAYASSFAWYEIKDPEGNTVAYGVSPDNTSVLSEGDSDWFIIWYCTEDASADASQTWNWSAEIPVELVGDYIAEHGGEAYAGYGHWEKQWVQTGCHWWQGHWETVYFVDGAAYAGCSSSRTVTSHAGVISSITYSHPYLLLDLPDGSKHFFSADGWGDPTTEEIVYTDGTWQVTIAAGTIIQLDGSWHKTTYLEIDNQGNVTGKYDAGGSTVAEEIGLSQPITITKVG